MCHLPGNRADLSKDTSYGGETGRSGTLVSGLKAPGHHMCADRNMQLNDYSRT